jgi:hypothetical protein
MEELRKYRLSVSDWDMLEVFRKVLSVSEQLFLLQLLLI